MKMNKTQCRRLAKLARFLRTVTPTKFDLNAWIKGAFPEMMAQDPTQPGDCGTTACAIGWCPVVFPDHWMYSNLRRIGHYSEPIYLRNRIMSMEGAASNFFGLTSTQVERLFMPQSYKNHELGDPKAVAKRLMRVARHNAQRLEITI